MKTNTIKFVKMLSLAGMTVASSARANDSFASEFSHFSGNFALASVTTVAVDKFAPQAKRPALTGFAVSASESVLGEAAQRMTGGKFSVLDAAVGIVGAAAGAYATDKWYIQPKLDTQKHETTASVMVVRHF